MSKTAPLVSLLLAAVALAGCADDAPHNHGVILTCSDGTVLDSGNFTDHHADNFTLQDHCPKADPPAISVMLGLSNLSPFTYEPVAATWDITPLLPEGHSMLTELRVSDQPGDNLTTPDSFGDVVDKREHQNTPASFEAEWVPKAPGTYYLRAYAENQGDHFWSQPTQVEVLPVEPTGVTHTITISAGGPAASVEPAALSMTIGDAVVWQNDDLLDRHIISTSGPGEFDTGAIGRGAASEPIVLLAPGFYEYSSQDPLSEVAELTGTIQVNLPG